MKQVAIGVAILPCVVLVGLVYKDHIAATEAAARISRLEKSQTEQLAAVRADVAALSRSIDRLAASLGSTVAATRDTALGRLHGVEDRVQRSLAALQGRLAEVSVEQDELNERLESELVARRSRGPEDALAQLPQEPAGPVPPQGVSPALDLPLQRAMQRGAAFYQTGRYGEARELFATVLDRQPENAEARRMHALSLYHENPADSASYRRIEADLQAFARGGDADPEALRVIGLLAIEQARWNEARDRFAQAIALAPGSPEDSKNLGLCSLRCGDLPAARRALDDACALAPTDAESWHYAGMAFQEGGDKEEALARFRRCLEIDSGYVAARVRSGTLLAELGRSNEALETLAPVRRFPEAATVMGDCYEHLGAADSARSSWLEAIGLVRENSPANRRQVASLYIRLARLARQRGEHVQCVAYCRQGLARDAEAAMLRALLGASQVALGEVDEGRRLLQEVARAYPGSDAGVLAAASLAAAPANGRR